MSSKHAVGRYGEVVSCLVACKGVAGLAGIHWLGASTDHGLGWDLDGGN